MLSIVVPTYLEAENIPPLITGVFDSLDETGISCEVIIVDDNSPDGIKNVVNQLVADYPV
ncbi:MAG: glycosyltransferase, partial [Gammaproteobacteria bacterium]|nr:glycosyltransferase [Gammaproteobacteria bacterium]